MVKFGYVTPKLDHIPSWIWKMINLGHGSSQIEITIWDVRNRNFDLGYPRLDLGHGHVWATTCPLKRNNLNNQFITI